MEFIKWIDNVFFFFFEYNNSGIQNELIIFKRIAASVKEGPLLSKATNPYWYRPSVRYDAISVNSKKKKKKIESFPLTITRLHKHYIHTKEQGLLY